MLPYILTDKALTVVIDQANHLVKTVHSEDIRFDDAVDALHRGDEEALIAMMDVKSMLDNFVSSSGKLVIEQGRIVYDNKVLPESLYIVSKILKMASNHTPVAPMLAFLENLMENPSYRSVTELLGFLEYGDLPITPDGHFLAYKGITSDYKDCHTRKIDNSVGQVITMERNAVDDDAQRTCSSGLHFASREYVRSFGSRTMVVKINPRDVVSIPVDYNNTKGRCCRYEVVGELKDARNLLADKNAWDEPVVNEYDNQTND